MNKLTILGISAIMTMSGCAAKKAGDTAGDGNTLNPDSTLVVYYSQTGITKSLGDEIGKAIGCKTLEIEAEVPYPEDYDATIQRWLEEMKDSVQVAIKPVNVDLSKYSTIFIGTPVWGGVFASPMDTWIKENELKGKTLITFVTFGSGGTATVTEALKKAEPDANVIQGFGMRDVRINKAPEVVNRFLIERGYIAGNIDALPDFPAYHPVTDSEKQVFGQACGDYKFPLGSPAAATSRQCPDGTEYRFDVDAMTPDGQPSKSTIYVMVENGKMPEFTEVIRQ